MKRPPLHLHILAHPQSTQANELARALLSRFMEPPASGCLRVPVFFTPRHGRRPAAETVPGTVAGPGRGRAQHGGRAHRRPHGAGGSRRYREGLADLHSGAYRRRPPRHQPPHLLPVALDPKGFELSGVHHSILALLDAKRAGGHLLLIDALEDGEPRGFPCLGNVPTVRRQFGDPAVDARRAIDRAVLEALRFKHNRAQLQRGAEPEETVLGTAPEAATLAYRYPGFLPKPPFLCTKARDGGTSWLHHHKSYGYGPWQSDTGACKPVS
jgi:hypothetical protein